MRQILAYKTTLNDALYDTDVVYKANIISYQSALGATRMVAKGGVFKRRKGQTSPICASF